MKSAPSSPPKGRTRHPLHPLSTHFPLALLGIAPLWDLIGLLRPEPFWWQFAFWSMAAGLAASLVTLVTGVVDWIAIPESHPAQGVANRHLTWMLTAVGLYTGNLLLRGGSQPPVGLYRLAAFLLSAAGLALLAIGGWYGGELVYRHGIGQRR